MENLTSQRNRNRYTYTDRGREEEKNVENIIMRATLKRSCVPYVPNHDPNKLDNSDMASKARILDTFVV